MVAETAAGSGDSLFIQFAREPVAGAVKTRMTPHFSPEQACELHCELLQWTSAELVAAGLGRVELAVAGDAGHPLFQRCLDRGVDSLSIQRGRDLGERMHAALTDGLARFRKVVLVGSDCPGIDGAYLAQALAALERADIVLGPAADGGYVLIGVKRVSPEIFSAIPWGSGEVYSETVAALSRIGFSWAKLATLADIDRPEDLPVWRAVQSRKAPGY